MARNRGQSARTPEDITDLALSDDPGDQLAYLQGTTAQLLLQEHLSPGPKRLNAFHMLRQAALRDPTSAYNLGNYLSDTDEGDRRRKRRQTRALAMYERAALGGMARLRHPDAPFREAPPRERDLRDLVSRALCNIGAIVSNRGAPELAVEYFRKALQIFPGNANAQLCLGNMGVFHSSTTGLDPMEGIAAWERAAKLGCRSGRDNVIRVARQIESDHGVEKARDWVSRRFTQMGTRYDTSLRPLAAKAFDIKRVTGKAWPKGAVRVADIVAPAFAERTALPLAEKVTFAASLFGNAASLAVMVHGMGPEGLDETLAKAQGVEPLNPFLGHDEWRYVGPPDTDYILGPDYEKKISSEVTAIAREYFAPGCGIDPRDAMFGILFHLDESFRRGIGYMASSALGRAKGSLIVFVPGTMIGSPPSH